MNLDSINKWLTLIANIGVVVGLIVLIFEIQESNRQAISNTNIARFSDIESSMREFALSDHLPGIYVTFETTGLSGLEAEDVARLREWELARIVRMEGQFVQYHDGYLPEAGYRQMLIRAKESALLWKSLGIRSSNPEFRKALEIDDDA